MLIKLFVSLFLSAVLLNSTAFAEQNLEKVIAIQQAQIEKLSEEVMTLKSALTKTDGSLVISNETWHGNATGLLGPAGPKGDKGIAGATGSQGRTGATGPAGRNGNSFMNWEFGNNGTISCTSFCERSNQVCVTAIIEANTNNSCSAVPGRPTHCLCAGR